MADDLARSATGRSSPRRGLSHRGRGLRALGLAGLAEVALIVGAALGGYVVSPVAAAADLTLTKVADASPVSAGDQIGYTITVANVGTDAADTVTLHDTLPTNPGLSWSLDTANSSADWTITAGVLAIGPAPLDLSPGSSVHVHIVSPTTAATCGTVNNSATVTSANDGSPSVGPVPIVVDCPSLTLTKVADASPVSAGDQIGYTISIHNTGAGSAAGVTLTDPLPGGSGSGVTWVKDLGTGDPAAFSLAGAPGSQALTLAGQPVSLAAGATLSVHITAGTSKTECGTYDNTATVASTNDGGNPATASIVCNPAELTLTKVADASPVSAGDQIGYTITVANTGAGVADTVTLHDTLPTNPGLSWSLDTANSSADWTITAGVLAIGPAPLDLSPGSSVHVHIVSPTTAATCGTVNNSATVTSANDGSPSVGPVPIVVDCPQTAGISISHGVSLSPAGPFHASLTTTPGSTIYNEIVVTNTGDVTLTGVTLTDSLGLPPSCVVPTTLAPGASFTCVYGRVAAVGTTITTATVDSDQTDPASAFATVVASAAATPAPGSTPPPTDTVGPSNQTGGESPLPPLLLGLFLVASGLLAFRPQRRRVHSR